MTCGGSMMRTNLQPLARLVDAAAEKWLAVASVDNAKQAQIQEEITSSFKIGDKPEITFHGLRYQLRIFRDDTADSGQLQTLQICVHEIVTDN